MRRSLAETNRKAQKKRQLFRTEETTKPTNTKKHSYRTSTTTARYTILLEEIMGSVAKLACSTLKRNKNPKILFFLDRKQIQTWKREESLITLLCIQDRKNRAVAEPYGGRNTESGRSDQAQARLCFSWRRSGAAELMSVFLSEGASCAWWCLAVLLLGCRLMDLVFYLQ
jgi:hypothetical protein